MEEYAGEARRLGLVEIGFCDHCPMLHTSDPTLSMSLEDLPVYVREVQEMRERFPQLTIRLGIEADYVPETARRLSALLDGFPFDYVMGSVHFVDGWCFDDPRNLDGYRGRDLFELWERYFELLGEAAESGMFDVLAHPDLIKKFGFRPERQVSSLYARCLDRVAASGAAVEVSTAGLRKPVEEIYPGLEFLRLCREREIPVTLGSDAHHPSEVGYRFEDALRLLREAGYGELAVFAERKRSELSLPS